MFFSEYCCENKVEGIQGDRYRRYAAGFFKKYFSRNGLNPHNLMKMEEIPFLSVLNVAVRNSLFDRCVQNLIDRDPGRTVVNIGCGFDTRYFRLRGYRGLYYDVDYVKVIGLKKRLFRRFNPSCHFTGVRDAFTDRFWKRELVLDRDNPVIVCEGVFCYIPYILSRNDTNKSLLLSPSSQYPLEFRHYTPHNQFLFTEPVKIIFELIELSVPVVSFLTILRIS